VIDLLLPLTLAYLTIGVVVAAAVDRPQLHAVLGWPVVATSHETVTDERAGVVSVGAHW